MIIGVLLVLLVVGAALFLQTEQFRSLAREQVVDTLNTTLKGHVSLDRIEGTLWGSLILHNFKLDYEGQTLVHVPQLIAHYALRPLLDGRVEVSEISVVEPIISLEQDAEGTINLLEAVSLTTPQEDEAQDSASTLIVNLENIVVEKGRITFRLPDQLYQLVETDLDAQVDLVPAGITAHVRRFATRLEADGLPPLRAQAAATYQNAQTPPSPSLIDIQQVRLSTDHSELELSGIIEGIENVDTLEANIQLALKKLAVADIVQLVPDAPLKHDISGTVKVTGQLNDLHSALVLNTADATIKADLQADLSQQEPSYQGTLHLQQIALPQLVDAGDIRAVVNGTVQAQGVGASLPLLNAKTDLTLTGLQVGDLQLGTLALQSSLANEIARVTGELTGALGHATWQGELALPEPPRYSLSLTADRLSLQQVAAGQESLSGELSLQANVQGQGFGLEDMATQADITIQPSTLGPVTIKHGRFVARLADGRIRLSEGTLTTPDASIQLEGELGTALEEVGQLSYALQIDRLAPWLALAGQDGSGQLTLNGKAEGSIENLQTHGRLTAQRLQLPGVKLAKADIQFAAEQIGQAQPLAEVKIGLRDLDAGMLLQKIDADVQLLPTESPADQRVQLAVVVQETPDRRHRLQAEILAEPLAHEQHITAQLSDLSLALPIGAWQLAQPVTIQYQQSEVTRVTIDRFVLADTSNPDQQLSLHGSLTTNGPQDLQLKIAHFSLDSLQDFLPPQPAIDGVFSADIQLAGTAAAPTLQGQAGLTGLQIAGQAYQGLQTTLGYQNKKATLDLSFQQDAEHALQASGSLPLALSWVNGFQSSVLGTPQFQAHSDGLNLAFLNAFSGKAVHDIAGEFHLDLKADGPADKPVLNGTFALTGGQARVKPLGLKIAPISLEGTLSPEQIAITQLLAKARQGTFTATGAVGLKDYQPDSLDLSLKADHWPAIWTRQYRVEIDSKITADGPFSAPNVNGTIDVWEAVLRPELSFLSAQTLSRDETISVRPTAAAPPVGHQQEEATSPEAESGPDILSNLALLLTLNLHHNSRVLHQNANIALAGGIEVKKKRGEDPRVVGAIELERGWAGFQGRRFVLDRGKITFSGGTQINPQLDILAQYKHDDYLIDAIVGGTGEEPSLDLRSDPPLEQADILAVLLFGKPASALGKGEQADLQQQAVSLTSGYAASTIGRSVSDALGLDELGLDLSDVDFSGGRVGLGRNLNRKTRISASQSVGGEEGQEVAIDYEIAPDWDFRTTTSSKGSSGADIIWRKRTWDPLGKALLSVLKLDWLWK